jgi:hypothetical protein
MIARKPAAAFAVAALVFLTGCSAPLIPREWGSWEHLAPVTVSTPIPGHEEPIRSSYLNQVAESVTPQIQNGVSTTTYPAGSIIVKAGFKGSVLPGQSESPAKLYAMVKRPEDPRARGGWIWVVRTGDDPREIVVDAPYCVDCHGYANKANPYGDKNPGGDFRDYVFIQYQAAAGKTE